MPSPYDNVISRTLSKAERRVHTSEKETPLVIEPLRSSNIDFLTGFLERYSAKILEDLARCGAVLLRGFEVESPGDFEQAILSIRGMSGMKEVLLSEPGRTVVDGTRFVFYTNTLEKTGGTLSLGNFHTENYYVPDVPRYISFFCQVPSILGGETGLLNVAKLYADLPAALKAKLESRACFTKLYSVADMVTRYGVCTEALEEFCAEFRLPIISMEGDRYVAVCKPSVVEHPLTGERALQVNFAAAPAVDRKSVV